VQLIDSAQISYFIAAYERKTINYRTKLSTVLGG